MKIKEMINEIQPILDALKGVTFFVAGGFCRDFLTGREYNDIDIFFKNSNDADEAAKLLLDNGGMRLGADREFYNTYKYENFTIQIMRKRNFQKPSDIDFDFTMCQACLGVAANGQIGFWYDQDFFAHATNKILVINNASSPMSLVERIVRFTKREYTIDNWQIKEAVKYINDCDEAKLQSEWYHFKNKKLEN